MIVSDKSENIYALQSIYDILLSLNHSTERVMRTITDNYHDKLPEELKSTTAEAFYADVKTAINNYKKALEDYKTNSRMSGTDLLKLESEFMNEIETAINPVINFFTKEYGVSVGSGREAISAKTSSPKPRVTSMFDTPDVPGGGIMLSGGTSLLKRLDEISVEKKKLPLGVAITFLSPEERAVVTKKMAELQEEELAIKSSELYLSMRPSAPSGKKDLYKINEEEYIINSAIEAIKNKKVPYTFTHPQAGLQQITNFRSLRKYILDYSNDPITLLLRLTDLNPISLDDFLPKIEDDKLTISRNEKGILVVNIDDDKVEMPNPLGNKNNRQEFSKKYKANTCYGLGGNKSDIFCVSLLDKCLASDEKSLEECKQLFISSDWEKNKSRRY